MEKSPVTYFYTANSQFAYLGHQEFIRLIRATGRLVTHKPFRLMECLERIGYHPLEERTNASLEYQFGRSSDRWAEYRSVLMPAKTPSSHDDGAELSDLVLISAVKEGIDVDYLSSVFMHNHWINNISLNDEKSVREILQAQGLNADNLLRLAKTKEVLTVYEENTKTAINLSVFGSPTYVVDGDMFYGQDNLVLVARALEEPFKSINCRLC